jgi:Tetratricopeptide repeat
VQALDTCRGDCSPRASSRPVTPLPFIRPARASEGRAEGASTSAMTARYQADQGLRSQAAAILRDVLAADQRVLGPDHPNTLITRYQIAVEMSELGDHDGALAEYRNVLATKQRLLGPITHPRCRRALGSAPLRRREVDDYEVGSWCARGRPRRLSRRVRGCGAARHSVSWFATRHGQQNPVIATGSSAHEHYECNGLLLAFWPSG